jgi:hypothetical protein
MLSWVVRLLLLLADLVAGLFVSRQDLDFGVIQAVVATMLVALFFFVLAFWPERWTHFLNRTGKS